MNRHLTSIALVLLLAVVTGCGRPPVAVPAPPSPPTPLVVVEPKPTPVEATTFTQAVAMIEGSDRREIHSPIAGYIIKQAYAEGALVRAGDLLFVIDANREHVQPGTASSGTQITSPIAGVAARAIPGLGDLVNPSTTLAVVSAIDPVTARFAVPQKIYRDHAAWFTQLLAQPIATRPENVRLSLEDGTLYPSLGKLTSIEIPPGESTRPVTATAQFANPDYALKPGQYARVRLTIEPSAVTPPR